MDTWKKFSKRLLSENSGTAKELGLRRYRQDIKSPGPELSFYTGPVTSTSFDFLTSLTITAGFPIRDLVNLADVVNLGILQIYESEESILNNGSEKIVPDRLFRAWAGLAVEKGAFSVLRILKFHVLQGGLTDGSLRHFNSFPALGLVYPGPKGMSERVSVLAKEQGWRALSDLTSHLIGSQFSNLTNVVDPQDDNHHVNTCVEQAWHIPFMNFGPNNPTSWDGSEVTTLPSNDRDEFLAALEAAEPPTHWLSGAKLDHPHQRTRRRRAYEYYDFVQGESWRKADWDIFCESLWRRMPSTITEGDVYCIDQFYGFTYLRLDRDLCKAGVPGCGAGIVSIGDTFKSIISTTPIVSILLGPRRLGVGFYNPSHTKVWHFLRTDIPNTPPNRDQAASNPPDAVLSTTAPRSSKRPQGEASRKMRSAKVQKFDDFFGAL